MCQYLPSMLTVLKNQFTYAQGRRERFREPVPEREPPSQKSPVLPDAEKVCSWLEGWGPGAGVQGGGLRALLAGRGHVALKPRPSDCSWGHPVPEGRLCVSKRPSSSARGFSHESRCHCAERQRPWWEPHFLSLSNLQEFTLLSEKLSF